MDSPAVVGTGILLRTTDGEYLFQERDAHLERNPGMMAPFGGGIEKGETPLECAVRELAEELEFNVSPEDLQDVEIMESHFAPGTYIRIFLVTNVDPDTLILHEGRRISKMSKEEALAHPSVTDFTKEVLSRIN